MNSIVWSFVKLVIVGSVLLIGGLLYYNIRTNDTLEVRFGFMDLYLRNKLSKLFSNADVKMQDMMLTWRKADENFFLHSTGVKIRNEEFGIDIDIPEISVYSRVGILFLWGDWGDSRVDIPKINVNFSTSKSSAGNSEKQRKEDMRDTLSNVREKLFGLFKSNVPIEIGSLVLTDESGDSITLDSVTMGTRKEYDGRVFSIGFSEEGASTVSMRLSEQYRDVVSLHVSYDHFNTKLLKYLAVFDSRFAMYSDLVISGTADIVLDADGQVEYGDINLYSLQGRMPYILRDKELKVQRFRARARYSDHKLSITNFSLFVDEVAFKMNASLDSVSGQLYVNIGGYELGTAKVCDHWPESFYPQARDWYCTNVLEGSFREPQISFHGSINDINNPAKYRVSSHIKDAVIRINDTLGVVSIVDGGMLLNKGTLVIRSEDYKLMNITAKEGTVVLTDMCTENAAAEMQGHVISDAYELYSASNAASIIGSNAENITGSASTKFIVKLTNMGSENIHADVSVKSEIRNLSIDKIFGSFNVRDVNMNFSLKNSDIDIRAVGKMNSRDMTFTAKRESKDAGNPDAIVRCEFDGYISGDDLMNFSTVANAVGISGYSKAKISWMADYSQSDNAKMSGILDISTLTVGERYLKLDDKQEGIFEFSSTISPNKDIDVQYARVVGRDIDINIKGKIGEREVDLIADKVKFLRTDVKAYVKYLNGSTDIKFRGNILDLHGLQLGAFFGEKSGMQNVNVDMYVKDALMNNDVAIKDLMFTLKRDENKPMQVKVRGLFADDNSEMNIEYGPRGLEVFAGNAGNFLRATDVLTTVEGGKLSVYMYPYHGNNKEPASGIFSLTRFNIVNAPILAQILTLSSLKGISNTLRGEGIHFSKLNVPFRYTSDTISFSESWMEGAELGISFGGQVNLNVRDFDVSGQIVPAYAVSKMVWRTPLVGKLLTGGHSRGIVAIDYKVKGTAKVHDISVNFLSILTPNLLKRALRVLDYKIMKQDDNHTRENSNLTDKAA